MDLRNLKIRLHGRDTLRNLLPRFFSLTDYQLSISREFKWYKADRGVYKEAMEFLERLGFVYQGVSRIDNALVFDRLWKEGNITVRFKWVEEPVEVEKGRPLAKIERVFEVYRNGITNNARRSFAQIIATELGVEL